MNATLQCLSHIEKFVEYFKYDPQMLDIIEKNPNTDNILSVSFKILINNLWPDDYDPSSQKYNEHHFAPEEFKNKISRMNPLFEGIAANDAKDLVNFIIMTLHIELNKEDEIPNIKRNNNVVDQTNKDLMFEIFNKDFMDKNHSIVSDIFYAINSNRTQCANCQAIMYNYQTYYFMFFPLEEVLRKKQQLMQNNQMNQFGFQYGFNNYNNIEIKEVNIYECFEYDRQINFMSGENSMYCNKCKQTSSCYMQTFLITGPEILIIILNRGKGIEFDVKINFVEELDLSNYIEKKNTGTKYKLMGVITHLGDSSMSGHFIAYCPDPFMKKWFKYNDAFVSEVKDFKKEVIDYAMPYLLFYRKIK